MSIPDFLILCDFDPNFCLNDYKIKIFRVFKKPYILLNNYFPTTVQNLKLIDQFLTAIGYFSPYDDVIHSNAILAHVQKNEWHNWIHEDIPHQNHVFVFQKYNIKIWPFVT